MKKQFAILAILLAAPLLPGCKTAPTSAQVVSTTTTTESSIQTAINALPATFKADVAAAVAKVATPKNLNTLANGIESLAASGAKLPSPASLSNGVLPWVEMLPDVGPIATETFQAYSVAYPLLKPTSTTLVAIGEFIRSLQPPPAATLTSAAMNNWRHSIQMAYCLPPRRED